MSRPKASTQTSSTGPLDLRSSLRERRTAWRVPQLTQMLSLGKHTLYDAIKSGELTATRIGTALIVNPVDALEWFEARTTGKNGKQNERF